MEPKPQPSPSVAEFLKQQEAAEPDDELVLEILRRQWRDAAAQGDQKLIPTSKSLADELHIARSTVQDWMAKLEDAGMVKRVLKTKWLPNEPEFTGEE